MGEAAGPGDGPEGPLRGGPAPVLTVDFLPAAEALADDHLRDEIRALFDTLGLRSFLTDAFRQEMERMRADMIRSFGIPTAFYHDHV